MAVYILLSRLTSQGLETIRNNPDRILEVDKELEKMGIKMKSQWAVLGAYDFVNVVEAKDNETIARASVAISSRGSVSVTTMPAIEIGEFISAMKKK